MKELKKHLGLGGNDIIKPIFSPKVLDFELNPVHIFTQILKTNLSLKSNKKYKSISQLNLIQAIANLIPSVYLFTTSNYIITDSLRPQSNSHWKDKDVISLGVQLNLSVFEIKSYMLNIANARNELQRSKVQLKKAELLLVNNAINTIFSYQETKSD